MTTPPSDADQPAQPMPQGWYDDPFTDHLQRYWTGTSWTKETRPLNEPVPTPSPLTPAPSDAPSSIDGSPVVVRDYLIASILALVFCLWPLAIPAVYFAVRTNSAKRAGRIEDALRYAQRARLFLVLSVTGGLIVAIYLLWVVMTQGTAGLGL